MRCWTSVRLSPVLNESIESAARGGAGSLFQHLGPAVEKARSPNRVFIRLTIRSHLSVDRSRSPEADECVAQIPRRCPMKRLIDQQADLKLDSKGNWEPVPFDLLINGFRI